MGESDSAMPLAASALRQSPFSALHSLEVTQEGDVIVLTGKVGSYYHKHLAEETVLAITGTHEIRNDIRVYKRGGST